MTNRDDELRKQVEERVAQEAASAPPGEEAPKIDSKMIRDCLYKNELGDGLLFAALHRNQFLYRKNTQEWLSWGGHHWELDIMGRSLAAVEGIVEHYLAESKGVNDAIGKLLGKEDDESKDELARLRKLQSYLHKRVSQLRADKRRTACLKFAHTNAFPLAIEGKEMDGKPMLFVCANGVLDLETGILKPGCPGDYLSLSSPIPFLGIDTPAPLWEKTLLEIYAGKEDLVAYLQRLFGYAMTGLVAEKVFPILYGRIGWNGRSLITETIRHIMGDMAGSIQAEMLLSSRFAKSSSGPSPDVMSLKGMRMAFASEIDEGQRFSASKIKWYTGKVELVARRPNDKYETRFPPTQKIFLETNILPKAPADDKAFWERLHVIPHTITFVKRDPQETYERRAILDLDKQLIPEFPGILAWLLRGCLLWQRDGLQPPEEVIAEGKKYQRNEDILADFIDECCQRGPAAKEASSDLYERFKGWYRENIDNDEKNTPSPTWFGKIFGRKFEKTKAEGRVVYHGVALKD